MPALCGVIASGLVLAAVASGVGGGARCSARGQLPDPGCTPGAIFPAAQAAQVCHPGYSRSVRDVPYSLKRRIYRDYGVRRHSRGSYEVDHLIPLELGGSNVAANLWPEAAPGFRVKDRLERALHDAVCAGRLELTVAQREIATDWHATLIRAMTP